MKEFPLFLVIVIVAKFVDGLDVGIVYSMNDAMVENVSYQKNSSWPCHVAFRKDNSLMNLQFMRSNKRYICDYAEKHHDNHWPVKIFYKVTAEGQANEIVNIFQKCSKSKWTPI